MLQFYTVPGKKYNFFTKVNFWRICISRNTGFEGSSLRSEKDRVSVCAFKQACLKNKGFTLAETLVAMSIGATVAVMGAVSIQKIRQNSYVSQGKTLLSQLYQKEKIFHKVYNCYTSDLRAVGFIPQGNFIYNAGFGNSQFTCTGQNQNNVKDCGSYSPSTDGKKCYKANYRGPEPGDSIKFSGQTGQPPTYKINMRHLAKFCRHDDDNKNLDGRLCNSHPLDCVLDKCHFKHGGSYILPPGTGAEAGSCINSDSFKAVALANVKEPSVLHHWINRKKCMVYQ